MLLIAVAVSVANTAVAVAVPRDGECRRRSNAKPND
jgi:hypothetical protein